MEVYSTSSFNIEEGPNKNKKVKQELKVQPVRRIKECQLKNFGHLIRINEEQSIKII